MRIGIFSDIHSNHEALGAVVAFYEKNPCDFYVCLGDVVGYGADPDPCCAIVRDFTRITVLGNHDAAVSGRMNYAYYYDAARNALDWHSELLSAEHLEWLKKLPYSKVDEELDLTFCHGSPINQSEFDYVFSLDQAQSLIAHFDELTQVTFIGHSHLTKSFCLTPNGAEDCSATALQFAPDKKYIVTVGSVGQPRDYDNRSCCTIFDVEKRRLEYHRVEYDIESAAKKIFDSRLASNFGKRLFLGI
ncbi:MAG: metallophosphoesterase family protein [Myxococcota bacterium]|jgi:predicted phosphodiesterase|nr:metallophosphoesterase family protein [Myxococcota bacterium]